jgi:thioredoxin-related protein
MFLLAFAPLFLLAQDGMKFEHGLSWKEIQAKAKAENKYILMDCFTTWCGPCTYMSQNIFPTKEAGAFFNANFINVKVQFDTTANDSEEVKAWFKDMQEINAKYKIRAYPTYLMFAPNGEAVHRAVGSSPVEDFIAKGKDAMDPEKQYYTQLKRYENGEKDPAFLRKFALVAQAAYDQSVAAKVSAEYIATITDLYTKENLEFLGKFTSSSKDKGFAVMLENPAKVNAVLGAGRAEERVLAIVMQENIYPSMTNALRAKTKPNWDSVSTVVTAKYPTYAEEGVSKAKLLFYQRTQDWPNFQTAVVTYMNKYGSKVSAAELNSYAWTVFENCKDMSCVAQALEWSKRSFAGKEEPMFMDTYANILYKLGKKDDAIAMQKKAIALLKTPAEKKTYEETLAKMEKGEKTWKSE